MITGDNVLTAASVGSKLNLGPKDRAFIYGIFNRL